MKSFAVKGFIALLVVMNLILFAEVCRLKSGPPPAPVDVTSYIGHPTLPDVVVIDDDGNSYRLREAPGNELPTMMVFFSSSDCPNCFSEKTLWAEVATTGTARVMGVAVSASQAEFREWVSYMDFAIPLYLDTTFCIFDSMDFKVTPLKVLVKGDGEVVWADPPRLSKPEQQAFWRDFNHAVKTYF